MDRLGIIEPIKKLVDFITFIRRHTKFTLQCLPRFNESGFSEFPGLANVWPGPDQFVKSGMYNVEFLLTYRAMQCWCRRLN